MRLAKGKKDGKIANVSNLSVRKAVKLLTEKAALDGSGEDGKHYWLIPPDLYAALDAEFDIDFDPFPYPRPDGFDGLTVEWGQSNYVNPLFVGDGITKCMRKAISEHRKGKRVVLVFPLDGWLLEMLLEAGVTTVRNLGKVLWRAIEDGTPAKNASRPTACFILDARPKISSPS
jgi:hypothetical protein